MRPKRRGRVWGPSALVTWPVVVMPTLVFAGQAIDGMLRDRIGENGGDPDAICIIAIARHLVGPVSRTLSALTRQICTRQMPDEILMP